MASSVTTTGNPSQRTVATGTGSKVADNKDHSCQEVIRLLKETLKYRTGDHHTFFVFGATLDFAVKKIYPTLWALYRYWLMPKKTAIVGYARSTLTVAQFRLHISKYIKLKDANEEQLFDQFLQHNVYVQGKYNEPEDFQRLGKTVEMLEQTDDDGVAVANNRLFYLALPPSVIEPVADLIDDFMLSKSGWNRVIIENPFGNHSESCEKLSRHIQSLYNKEEPYRIHQYLNNEMALNLSTSPGMTIRLEETELDLSDMPESFQDYVHHYPQDLHFPDVYERNIMGVFGWFQNAILTSLLKQTRDLLKELAFIAQLSKTNKTIDSLSNRHLNSLPALPLRIIFSKLSLLDVLQMGQVYSVWESYQEEILSKVDSITLQIGRPVPQQPVYSTTYHNPHFSQLVDDEGTAIYPKGQFDDKWFKLEYASFPSNSIRFYGDVLHNLVNMQIILNEVSCEELESVIEFSKMWSSSLITLKMWCSFCEGDCNKVTVQLLKLLNWINTLPELKNLCLELQHNLYPTSEDSVQVVDDQLLGVEPHFELSILSRLHHFRFYSLDLIDRTPLLYSLMRFVPFNPMLTQIRICNEDRFEMYVRFAELCPTIASRITSLSSDNWLGDLNASARFSSLTEMFFSYSPNLSTFSELVNNFTRLVNLVRLHLHLSPEMNEDGEFVDGPTDYFSQDDGIPRSGISQLVSVRMLTLEVDNLDEDTNIDSVHWAWAFPNLQILEIITHIPESPLHNVPRSLRSLLLCPKLTRIYIFARVWSDWSILCGGECLVQL